MEDLQDALLAFGATFVGNLGVGGTAIVYHVLANNTNYALKIVCHNHVVRFEREISWLQWQRTQNALQNIVQLEASTYLPSGSLAALLYPVGTEMQDTREYLPEICRVLSGLHRANWRHGDARMPNFILADDEDTNDKKVIIIDFGYVLYCENTIAQEVPFEMYRIAASFLTLTDNSDLDQDAEDLIANQTPHIDIIRDAITTYVNAEYTEETVIEFAQTLLTL
jgi:serine/threonine protein kinase